VSERFVAEHDAAELVSFFDQALVDNFIEAFGEIDGGARVCRGAMIVRLLRRATLPGDEFQSGPVTREARLSEAVRRAITGLENNPNPDAGVALARLSEDGALTAWRSSLRHAQAKQARLRRDRNFTHPGPVVIRSAIGGGPPVNSADLRAVVMEELGRLRGELRTNDTTPWKRYWNVSSAGKVTDPLIENQCRDHLLDRLRDQLGRYRIAAAVPEARRGEETRADMLMLTGAGRTLPVEAKRHFHPDIWTAASTQLQGYTAAEGAAGFGIYLVFWFGNEASPTPARTDGTNGPRSAGELESILIGDLAVDLRARTEVIVFDVSDPKEPTTSAPRKKRALRNKGTAA
jgi:hypothetical protein